MTIAVKTKHHDQWSRSDQRLKEIQVLISRAADVVSPVWPLKTFVACNPLQGFEDLPFEEALAKSYAYKELNRRELPQREAVNREMIKWLTVFLDEGQATIQMPGRAKGFYRAFAGLARFDGRLGKNRQVASWLAGLPQSPEEAIAQCLDRLSIGMRDREEFFRQSLAALPGWSGYVKWNSDWRRDRNSRNPINLTEYLAVRLVLTCILWPDACVLITGAANGPAPTPHHAAEEQYRGALLQKLLAEAGKIGSSATSRPDAQLVFCIDVRSEPFRRRLEETGNYQTLGFAGFFGLPVRIKGYDDEQAHDSCPVLVKACHEVCEQPADTRRGTLARHNYGRLLLELPKSLYQSLKYHFTTPFALVEMLGPWLGWSMFARTFLPVLTGQVENAGRSAVMPDVVTFLAFDDMTLEQKAAFGESALRMMGLTANIAPFVVFCGHGSTTTNNAYASALDCGACGGNHGGRNAQILATILNDRMVRLMLAQRGLAIPEDTVFVAAEHDTTTDHVELVEADPLGSEHFDALARLRTNLARAGEANAVWRCATFGATKEPKSAQAALRRSRDWAQPRPEWGLARNAAFIVGPRDLTRHVDLQGRCFLHSYDWSRDESGKLLQTILTAPMVVAHWINSQYLFSTLDNGYYGAGSKVTKNVVGKIGVMQGNASDLMHGLPLQSVYASDDQQYHEPLRLFTVVLAPRQVVTELIELNPVLRKLFSNGWVTLACIEPAENVAYLLQRDLAWQPAHWPEHKDRMNGV